MFKKIVIFSETDSRFFIEATEDKIYHSKRKSVISVRYQRKEKMRN